MKKGNIGTVTGGTGGVVLLTGLIKHTDCVDAMVGMTDNGGSSGELRTEYGILPPGDITQCGIALSPLPEPTKKALYYRVNGGPLDGHSVKNVLFTSILAKHEGNYESALEEFKDVLQIRGNIIPVTLDDCQLCAVLKDGTRIEGETDIDIRKVKPGVPIEFVYLKPPAKAYPRAVDALENGGIIVIGPGDLYTSIICNLLVEGIPEAIRSGRSKGTKVVYVCNLMTKHGETDGYTALDHIMKVDQYLRGRVVTDVVVNIEKPADELLEPYREEESYPVRHNREELIGYGVNVIEAELLSDRSSIAGLYRHHPDKLGRLIMDLW